MEVRDAPGAPGMCPFLPYPLDYLPYPSKANTWVAVEAAMRRTRSPVASPLYSSAEQLFAAREVRLIDGYGSLRLIYSTVCRRARPHRHCATGALPRSCTIRRCTSGVRYESRYSSGAHTAAMLSRSARSATSSLP